MARTLTYEDPNTPMMHQSYASADSVEDALAAAFADFEKGGIREVRATPSAYDTFSQGIVSSSRNNVRTFDTLLRLFDTVCPPRE